LFFLQDIGFERIQKFAGLQVAVAVIIALALTNSYSSATTQLKGSGFLIYVETFGCNHLLPFFFAIVYGCFASS
jgi:hypothetical protein